MRHAIDPSHDKRLGSEEEKQYDNTFKTNGERKGKKETRRSRFEMRGMI